MAKANLPNLENATPGGLIDIIGDLRAQQKELKQREGIYTEALKGRFPTEFAAGIEGEAFIMNPTTVTQTRLETENVKALLDRLKEEGKITDHEFGSCYKEVPMTQMKFTARPKPPEKKA
jgi:hypothetical protein